MVGTQYSGFAAVWIALVMLYMWMFFFHSALLSVCAASCSHSPPSAGSFVTAVFWCDFIVVASVLALLRTIWCRNTNELNCRCYPADIYTVYFHSSVTFVIRKIQDYVCRLFFFLLCIGWCQSISFSSMSFSLLPLCRHFLAFYWYCHRLFMLFSVCSMFCWLHLFSSLSLSFLVPFIFESTFCCGIRSFSFSEAVLRHGHFLFIPFKECRFFMLHKMKFIFGIEIYT